MKVLALLAVLFASSPVHADVYQWLRIGGEGVAVGASEALKPELAPSHCRWCRDNPVDATVRSSLVWNDGVFGDFERTVANGLSYATLGGDIGVALYAAPDRAPVVESMSVAALATQVIKFSVGRQRPYAHFGVAAGDDDNLSFCSEHTAIDVAGAVSAGMETHETWVWVTGLGLSGLTGYLRIAADKHWASDVLAGAAVGAIAGFAVTKLTYTSSHSTARVYAVPLLSRSW